MTPVTMMKRLLLLLLLLASHIFFVCDGATSTTKKTNKKLYEINKKMCQNRPVLKPKHEKSLKWLFQTIGEINVATPGTPQNEAACWMFRDNKTFRPQRFVLATIYYATKGNGWDINTDWMSNKHECTWYGVHCDFSKKVVNLDLGYITVDGLIPREIGLLTQLRDLDLHGNELQGVIPHKLMAGLKKIQYLRLHMNGLFGAIHKEITHMKYLKELYIFGNYIAGTIPKQLSQMKKLEVLDLYANQLEGTIPSELAQIPNLRYLDVHDNNLVGTMPKEICAKKLDMLVADCHGRYPEVRCDCCTICCEGLPNMICIDQTTKQQVDYPF